jgi:histidinol-phosphate aminotransferase
MAYADPTVISLLNKIKPPYNIGGATQEIVNKALLDKTFVQDAILLIKSEKAKLISEFEKIPEVISVLPSHANFLLVKLQRAQELFDFLIREKVITRNRSSVPLCEDTIRITIGLPKENSILLEKVKSFYL